MIYTYIKEKYKNFNLTLINNSQNENIINFLSTKTETKKVDANFYSYLNTLKKDQLFDFIILLDNNFIDDDTDIIPRTLFFKDNKDKKFWNISYQLNERGKFLFNLILKNRYLKEPIIKKLNSIFKNINIFEANELDCLVVCSND